MMTHLPSTKFFLNSMTVRLGLVGSILAVSSCVTTPPPAPVKTTTPTDMPAKAEEAPPKSEEAPSESILPEMVGRLSEPAAPLTDADAATIAKIANSSERSDLSEAAQVLAALKLATSPLVRPQNKFEEADLSSAAPDGTATLPPNTTTGQGSSDTQPPGTTSKTSDSGTESVDTLEKIVAQRGLDLVGALGRNPFLQSASVHRQVVTAASRPGNSEGFTQALRNATARQVDLWKAIAGDIGNIPETPVAAPETVSTPEAVDPNAPPPSLTDLRSGDDVIAEAEALASRGEFEQAVGLLSSVDGASPMYPMAQERLKTVSNRAVQDLRRQAAIAFQTAAPLTDPKSRAVYLEQAKTLLETALAKYPAADQLPTVRENLAVISRDLARIAADRKQ
jgi:hypothetical protein